MVFSVARQFPSASNCSSLLARFIDSPLRFNILKIFIRCNINWRVGPDAAPWLEDWCDCSRAGGGDKGGEHWAICAEPYLAPGSHWASGAHAGTNYTTLKTCKYHTHTFPNFNDADMTHNTEWHETLKPHPTLYLVTGITNCPSSDF